MTDCSGEITTNENVADNWEEDGEISPQFEQRQRQILKRKQKEEEMAKAREAAALEQMQQCASSDAQKPGGFKILKRPQSYGMLPSSSQAEQTKAPEPQQQSKLKSLEERQAAYIQARERIFANYTPEDDSLVDADLQKAGSASATNLPSSSAQQFIHNPIQVPRPRPPAPLMSVRAQPFQPVLPGLPVVDYTYNIMPNPVCHHPARIAVVGQLPFYDARIPPPPPPVFNVPTMMGTAAKDQSRASPVPYGRPPAVLLTQKPFSTANNSSLNQPGER